ncbi:hypothetical protein [Cohnella cholangitidis]|uniref:Uncharacterized protein n=1 Tax=Cohnella cholangitidis TaxID=2598458 RepID=A0A7G5C4U8_9BACL|nr:hypothetical protein [Cohnella cholangitidis]QMV44232.1 hypothetical protein FPL14_25990 [Cohnella cholangitidis]
MRNRIQPWFAVVLVFMAIGLAARLSQGSIESWLIPVLLVAIVFLLYKFPPSRWKNVPTRGRSPVRGSRPEARRAGVKSDRRRTSPFTVIEGRKNKDDEPPRYH